MSYLSDLEYSDNNEIDEGDEGDLSSVESIDEDIKNYFYKATVNDNYYDKVNKEIDVKTNNNKQKKNNGGLSLQEFTKKIITETPKKFVSKRVASKKPEIIKKRSFNPRLPPYNSVHKQKKIQQLNLNDNSDFPSL
jgi:hypothetical protein